MRLRVVIAMRDGVDAPPSAEDGLLRIWTNATAKLSDRLEDDTCQRQPRSAAIDRFLVTL